jgi:hypothetical protein
VHSQAEEPAGERGTPTLVGRYRIRRKIGPGGIIACYDAHDVVLHRPVSIRAFHPSAVESWDARELFLERFRREARAAAALHHRSIVAVFDVFEEDGVAYIVTEQLSGSTLQEVLDRSGRLGEQRALRVTMDVCAALQYSHSTGVFHRDIAAWNVLLLNDETIKITGFGFARVIADATTQALGDCGQLDSFLYMAPEQARGGKFDAASDIYATGVLLYQLLTGHPPFSAESPTAVLYLHVRQPPPRPTAACPDLSALTDEIVLKALAKDPAERYHTAGDLIHDLQRALYQPAEQPAVRPAAPATAQPADGTPAVAQAAPAVATSGVEVSRPDSPTQQFEYDFAFSFASETRDYVERTKRACAKLGLRVFYDRDVSGRWWGRNFIRAQRRVYGQAARYFVPFISAEYFRRPIPTDEFEAAIWLDVVRGGDYILPVLVGGASIPPDRLPPHRAHLKAEDYSPEQLAREMLRKLSGR